MHRMHRMSDRGGQAPTLRKKRLGARSARACPSHASQKPLRIKVLSDLCILSPAVSIDIKVFQTFGPYARAAPSCKSCSSWPSRFRQLNAGEGQALALRQAPQTQRQVR